jgi:hypothetical protein
VFNRLAQFRRIRTINQIRQFVNYLIWELDVIVHEQAQGDDYVDAQGKRYFNREEARVYDAFMDQCWQVDACGLKEAVTLETRAKMLLELIKDDEFMAGHDAAEAAQEWARTNIPLHLVQSYWSAGCFDAGDTDRMYRDGVRPEDCAEVLDVDGELMPIGYAACMRLPF